MNSALLERGGRETRRVRDREGDPSATSEAQSKSP